MKTVIRTLLIVLFIPTAFTDAFAQGAEERLPEAVRLEEVTGDLEGAIEVYRSILLEFPENKHVAAEACFRMGSCYEKLGKQEAQSAYNRVIKEYFEQEEIVSLARARLEILNQPAPVLTDRAMSIRQVWIGDDVDMMGEVSPDGKYISFVDWETGDLALYEIANGQKRHLTSEGDWEDPNQFAEFSSWSPDGKRIVYDWYHDDNPSFISFHISDLNGNAPEVLWNDTTYSWSQCYDWSPDGKHVLACFSDKDDEKYLGVVSTSDGSIKLLKRQPKTMGWLSWPKEAKFSPDSRFIAYDAAAGEDHSARDIYLLSMDGSAESTLVDHPANDYLLGWNPDGKSILFASNRNGENGAYMLPIEKDLRPGHPILVKPKIGIAAPLGITDNGSCYFGIHERMSNIYVAEIQPESGRLNAPAEIAVHQFEGFNKAPVYSSDGKCLAYVSMRSHTAYPFGHRWGGNVLCIQSLIDGRIREIRPSLDVFGYPACSPNGSSVLVVHWNFDNAIELYLIDVESGKANVFSRPDPEEHKHFGGHGWFPDGKRIFYGLYDNEKDSWDIVMRDLESKKEEILFQSGDFYTISLSPDGQWFALTCPSDEDPRILLVPASGAESRELYRFPPGTYLSTIPSSTWTSDGKYLLFNIRTPTRESPYELCRIPISGGEPEQLGHSSRDVFLNLDAHPDGRHIVYSTAQNTINEIWVMDNYLNGTADR
jgi:Tol biopolymer transport system component